MMMLSGKENYNKADSCDSLMIETFIKSKILSIDFGGPDTEVLRNLFPWSKDWQEVSQKRAGTRKHFWNKYSM